MPIEINRGKVEVSEIEFCINYYQEYVIYELPYHVTYEINGQLMYDSIRYDFFIFRVGEKSGYFLKNIEDSFRIKINSDSILKLRAYGGPWDMADVFKEVKIIAKHEGQLDRQKTIIKYHFDHYFYDSAHLYYDKELLGVRFSFSKSLDSMYQSKLVRALFFIKNKEKKHDKNTDDYYVNSFELKNISSNNEEAIMRLVEAYSLDLKKSISK